ncbi:nitrogen regulatory protein P-II [Ruminiclostridium papyrosolvens DSM 2782]|uniref:Nitrogen regulatory protein P-II n=1 Tax=Ruminiclostridium papyrosolvens DSM 2782 TaxID=588581 RepID=F1TGG2_9FIRM|nr:P-II family nitrogen regulator [Ruminiclostridium papyrosolvens]EGD46527.1 nitrogen regulatory protein P-II [Ruminiclostridium papyrosolvens DSM 2782]WES35258.1 P-II family nitrogen regulator [Ruminiclostridium papyrosolvens DSM 2782]
MKKIEMIIRPEKLEDVKEILNESQIFGMTVLMVSGCGHQKGRKEIYRGAEVTINLLPKVMVQTVVHDDEVQKIIEKVTQRVKTGNVGDGKIFVYNVEEAVKIRTSESGENAI